MPRGNAPVKFFTAQELATRLKCETRTVAMHAYSLNIGELITNILVFSEEEARQIAQALDQQGEDREATSSLA